MVNRKQIQDKRAAVLACLFKAGGQTLSGVRISEQTGISRVAVWKHIKALQAAGIDIQSQARGYALTRPGDLLMPLCFGPDLGERIFYDIEVTSTMDAAKARAAAGAPHMSCCVAEHQTRGRGRLNRQWVSDRGGLWFTLILRPDLPPPMAYIYNFAASLSLSRSLNRMFGVDTRVKWPNDLLLQGKKLVGMLSEIETRADMITHLLIGIGINVNNDPAAEAFSATSLKAVLGRSLDRRDILTQFLRDFQDLTRDIRIPDIMAQWKRRTSTIGTRVRVETVNHISQGVARDVDDDGSLILETDNNETSRIIYGDCFHL